MPLTLRQKLILLAILMLLSNEHALRIIINLLITVHVLATILRGWLNTCVDVCLVRFSDRYRDELEDLRFKVAASVAPRVRATLVAAAPLMASWVRESPQYLCRVNLAITEHWGGALERLQGENDLLAAQAWANIQQAARAFCSLVEHGVVVSPV